MIKEFGLAWISVSNVAKAKKFFVEKLGLRLSTEDKENNWAELSSPDGGAILGLAKDEELIEVGSNAVVTFTVDNLEQTKAELQKKGVRMLGDIMEIPNHVKLQHFVDDDGNNFQLVELLG